jgi:hypothetical protein
MKKKKRKISKKLILILITTIIILLPSTTALSINSLNYKENEEPKTIENTNFLGSVYGTVRYSPDGYYGDMPVVFAKVKIGNKITISDIIEGGYKIRGLQFDKEYTITCSHTRFKIKTTTVTLTREKQNLEVNIFYYSGDERDIFSRNIEKINTVHENP